MGWFCRSVWSWLFHHKCCRFGLIKTRSDLDGALPYWCMICAHDLWSWGKIIRIIELVAVPWNSSRRSLSVWSLEKVHIHHCLFCLFCDPLGEWGGLHSAAVFDRRRLTAQHCRLRSSWVFVRVPSLSNSRQMHFHFKIKSNIGVQVTRVYPSSYFERTPLGSLKCPVESTDTRDLGLMSHPKDTVIHHYDKLQRAFPLDSRRQQ